MPPVGRRNRTRTSRDFESDCAAPSFAPNVTSQHRSKSSDGSDADRTRSHVLPQRGAGTSSLSGQSTPAEYVRVRGVSVPFVPDRPGANRRLQTKPAKPGTGRGRDNNPDELDVGLRSDDSITLAQIPESATFVPIKPCRLGDPTALLRSELTASVDYPFYTPSFASLSTIPVTALALPAN